MKIKFLFIDATEEVYNKPGEQYLLAKHGYFLMAVNGERSFLKADGVPVRANRAMLTS